MTSYNLFLTQFHFIRPLWLLAFIVLFLVLWFLKKHQYHQSPWQKFLPSHLSRVLIEGASNHQKISNKPLQDYIFLIRPFLIGILSITALAGPTWKKLPQPVYNTERGSVLIMDMSYSMYASDIKPNRLTRARFKAVDLLNKINNGDVGLIAYAGDAFVISPLTQDVKNIELLLPSLSPDIMPELGSNPYAAVTLAHEMLNDSGHLTGDIYWFTDDIDNDELTEIIEWSNKFGHQLNILGIGTSSGAPIKLPSGELLKDKMGSIVVPKLPIQKLQSLASNGHGKYQTISNDDSDIDYLTLKPNILDNDKSKRQENQQTGDQWQEEGAWLLLVVLPLTLSYFRRGGAILLISLTYLPLMISLSLISPVTFANEGIKTEPSQSFVQQKWQDLWKTKDQQAQQQYNNQNYQGAAEQFENSQWQGSAHYKAGNYQKALDSYRKGEQSNNANSLYNQGNSLAQMQKYEEAIKAYEEALKKNPDLQDAKSNLEKVKQQKKKQEKKEQSKGDNSNDDKSKDKKSENKSDNQEKQNKKQQEQNNKNQDKQPSESSSSKPTPKEKQKTKQNTNEEKENKPDEAQQKQVNQEKNSPNKSEEKTAKQLAAEQKAKETSQKHQQLLNKVTDDPYLLLRNKMQLEYQKRRQYGTNRGVQKQW